MHRPSSIKLLSTRTWGLTWASVGLFRSCGSGEGRVDHCRAAAARSGASTSLPTDRARSIHQRGARLEAHAVIVAGRRQRDQSVHPSSSRSSSTSQGSSSQLRAAGGTSAVPALGNDGKAGQTGEQQSVGLPGHGPAPTQLGCKLKLHSQYMGSVTFAELTPQDVI